MVGGGSSRRDEGSLVISSTNVFAALETLKKKKKSDKGKGGSKSGKLKPSTSSAQSKEPQVPPVFWAPAPLNSKSWADVDDDDDDDYYATTAPPPSVWGQAPQGNEQPDNVEETERQLSKKERKKKELAELEALLADFGVAQKDSNGQVESRDASLEKKDGDSDGEGGKKESAPGESKSAKKKKKKAKEPQEKPNTSEVTLERPEAGSVETSAEQPEEEGPAIDMKERLKKMASVKKKKSNKEMDSAAKAAAQEAAARSAKLAAAKKKEKNHYNQQPVRTSNQNLFPAIFKLHVWRETHVSSVFAAEAPVTSPRWRLRVGKVQCWQMEFLLVAGVGNSPMHSGQHSDLLLILRNCDCKLRDLIPDDLLLLVSVSSEFCAGPDLMRFGKVNEGLRRMSPKHIHGKSARGLFENFSTAELLMPWYPNRQMKRATFNFPKSWLALCCRFSLEKLKKSLLAYSMATEGQTMSILKKGQRRQISPKSRPAPPLSSLFKHTSNLSSTSRNRIHGQALIMVAFEVMEVYQKRMKELAERLLVVILKSVGIREECMGWSRFPAASHDGPAPCTALQLNSYPPCPDPARAVGLAAHTDSFLLTVLRQASSIHGLQVLKEGTGWVRVVPVDGALVVNVGDMLHIMSNGRFRNVRHRVVVNQTGHRMSIAYFYGPPIDYQISPVVQDGSSCPGRFRPVTVQEYIEMKAKNLEGAISRISET
ncbi:hypothetical protein SAY87_009654 [Trapa incisa]|uniref:Fe2OG dioxygenase domain-containing protein n=1 Tax=Trapa incisa TaxID=236973 RepID=A0AAN7PXE6_9MYRT|nr:hypothetical protein SAY87_009654 [Trapa incisa]